MAEFDIIVWLGNRVGYDIPKGTLENIVMERGLQDITDYSQLTQRDKDLTMGDLLYSIWTSPSQTASRTWSHGDATESRGAQIQTDRANLYRLMMSLYRKWNDPMAEVISGGVQWLDY